jgi:hypothetical protein
MATVYMVCAHDAKPFSDEALAEKAAAMMNRVRACGGSEHMVIAASTALAARDAYRAAMAHPMPPLPERKDIDG